jgi:DNA-binding MarR family transcriptional regulator
VPSPTTPVFSTNTYLLQLHASSVLEALEEALDPLGISARQYVLLGVAADASELSQVEIASYIGVEPTVLGKLLRDLEERGLLIRQRANEDRRRHSLSLTESGKSLFRQAEDHRAGSEQRALIHLTKTEQRTLRALLTKAAGPH